MKSLEKDVSRVEFFQHWLKILKTLYSLVSFTDSEIKVLSYLMANESLENTGITKNNLHGVFKKLKESGWLTENGELNSVLQNYKRVFTGNEIVLSLKFNVHESEEKA